MKKISLVYIFCLIASMAFAQDGKLSPFYKLNATQSFDLEQAKINVENAFVGKSFDLIGDYHPENNEGFRVLCFTRKDLSELCLKSKDRGALASVIRVGISKKGEAVNLSLLNPQYVFCAYLSNYESDKLSLMAIANDAKEALTSLGGNLEDFGGVLTEKDLKKYHYKMMMPYFNDPVELNTFTSFEDGLAKIRKNLESRKGNTTLVYEQVFTDEKVAVFGVGLMNAEDGEGYFLPIIGEDHIAAMPYEIILQGNEATMLHGKYRFALYWPELTMGTFMKIMSTPGDVEDFLEGITQ
ncbi:hypothetical protein [Ancylomarina sp.]|uniref:hypothetical protein n=1 Tax=Ancylomarina sp. TaxID=1970196 RepID=UPI0035677EE4